MSARTIVAETARYAVQRVDMPGGPPRWSVCVKWFAGTSQEYLTHLNYSPSRWLALGWMNNLQEAYDTPRMEVVGKTLAQLRREGAQA